MASPRFTQATHPVVLHCFIRDVFIPLAGEHSLKYVVYEDGFYDKIDFAGHFTRAFTWHSPLRAFKYGGKMYGAAADLNTVGGGAGAEAEFMLDVLFPRLRGWGIAGRWEGGTHTHIDAGANEAFGDSARLHTQGTHIGRPDIRERGNPIAINGAFDGNCIKKLQYGVGVTPDGLFGPATKRATQAVLGVRVDGSFGPQSVRALQKRVGTRVDGSLGPNTVRALRVHLMLGRKL